MKNPDKKSVIPNNIRCTDSCAVQQLVLLYLQYCTFTHICNIVFSRNICNIVLREGFKKKKITENSVKVGGWGQHRTNFPLFIFFLKKNMVLKHLKLPKNHFKTN